jgi:hypothetical protein
MHATPEKFNVDKKERICAALNLKLKCLKLTSFSITKKKKDAVLVQNNMKKKLKSLLESNPKSYIQKPTHNPTELLYNTITITMTTHYIADIKILSHC